MYSIVHGTDSTIMDTHPGGDSEDSFEQKTNVCALYNCAN
jgi:hypothetical protein